MADPEPQTFESLTVMCPTCHERFGVRLAVDRQSAACTFCGAQVAVPSRDEARKRQKASNVLPAPTVEDYALAEPADLAFSKPAWRMSPIKSPAAANHAPDLVVTLECPTCHERLKAKVGLTAGKTTCSFCGVLVLVPDQKTVTGWQARAVAPRRREEIGEYTAGPVVPTVPVREGGLFDRLAEIRREAAPLPPRWTFFSGVFTFPWRSDAFVRWGFLTIGFTAMAAIGLVVKGLAASLSGMAGGVALAFFLLPIIWITFATCSYAAACGLCLLESTAAGLDRVESWPDPNWKEWMAQLIYLVWIGAIPVAASYGLGLAAQLAGGRPELASPVIFFVLYPIALMSALEANTIWVPLTLPIVTSLYRWIGCWFMFYLLAGLVAAGVTAIFVYSISTGADLLLLTLGPLTSAATLIYFRLLGRLAWRMTTKRR